MRGCKSFNVSRHQLCHYNTLLISQYKTLSLYVMLSPLPVKKVWDMVRKISGKNISPTSTHLITPDGREISDQNEIFVSFGTKARMDILRRKMGVRVREAYNTAVLSSDYLLVQNLNPHLFLHCC